MQVWNVLHAARWRYRTQKNRQNSPSAHHRTTLSDYIFATGPKTHIDNRRNLLNSNVSAACHHNMANFGPLSAVIGSGLWGTQANFNGFRVLASLLQRRRSTEANQILHDVWPSPGLVHCIYILGLLPRNGFLPGVKFTLRPSLALSYIGSVTARHSSSGCQPNFAALSRRRNLYSAGRPSRWALAHILVFIAIGRLPAEWSSVAAPIMIRLINNSNDDKCVFVQVRGVAQVVCSRMVRYF